MLKNILDHKIRREEGSSLIFAILVMMIMLLVTVVVATTAVTAAATANQLSSSSVLKNAAETGMQNALYAANNATTVNVLEAHRGSAKTVLGVMTADSSSGRQSGEIRWGWYTEQVELPGQITAYYVYSTGYSNVDGGINKGVKLRAQFIPALTTGGAWDASDSSIHYALSTESVFEYGITGTNNIANSVTVESGVNIYAADSNLGNNATGTSTSGSEIASNTSVTIGGSTGLEQLNFAQPAATGSACSGTGCSTVGITYRNYKLDMTNITNLVNNNCPASSYPVWVASAHAGILDLNQNDCVGGLVFDVTTTVPASWNKGTPLRIYNLGNTTIDKGVTVNYTNTPAALKIYSSSGALSVGTTGTNTSLTKVNAYFVSATGLCETAANTIYFGALSCGQVILKNGSTIYIDLASRGVELNQTDLPSGTRYIWNEQFEEEL